LSAGGHAAPVAGVGRRFVAFLVDCAVIGLVAGGVVLGGLAALGVPLTGGMTVATQAQAEELLGSVTILWAVTGALGLVYWLGIWFWEGRTGRTIGNLLLGLRTVRAEDRSPLGFGRAALRWIVIGLGAIACGVGEFLVALSPAFDKSGRGQGWHDKAAKAVVLDVRAVAPSASGAPHAPAEPFAAMPPTGAFAARPRGTRPRPRRRSSTRRPRPRATRPRSRPDIPVPRSRSRSRPTRGRSARPRRPRRAPRTA